MEITILCDCGYGPVSIHFPSISYNSPQEVLIAYGRWFACPDCGNTLKGIVLDYTETIDN